jgi:hypothetical protein
MNWRFFIEVPLRLKFASQVDGTRAVPLAAQCSGRLFFKSVASTSSASAQSRDGGPLFVVNVELKHRFVTSDVEFDVMYRSSFVITAPLDEGYQC